MAEVVAGPVTVRVPASSANLGPGFDALGLALSLRDVVTAEVTADAEGGTVSVAGEGAGSVALDESHLVRRAMKRGFEELGARVPGVRLHCENSIPHGRGLGSSSAAIVAGLWLARELVVDGRDRMDDDALFAVAAELEGHPDNVAAAVYGGFTIAFADRGRCSAVRLEVDPQLTFVAFVPPAAFETKVARGLLPAVVPHADASRNAGRAALLVAALTGRRDQLLAATEDRLHQDYRASAMPDSAALVDALRREGVATVVSGAGPTVLAMTTRDRTPGVLAAAPGGWRVHQLEVDPVGASRAG